MRLRSVAPLLVGFAVALSACHQPDKYLPVAPDNKDGLNPDVVLAVTPSPTSLPGDGLSQSIIEARIAADATLRHITFQTNLGSLSMGGQVIAAGTSVTLQADAEGVARVLLVSAAGKIGTAQVTVSVGEADATKPRIMVRVVDVPFTAVTGGTPIITLEPGSLSAPADGASRIRLVAHVSPSLPSSQRTVTFTTSDGEFTSNTTTTDKKTATVVADLNNTAVIDLRSSTVGSAAVKATVFETSAHALLTFERSFPTTVFIQVNKTAVTAAGSDSVAVEVTLLRDVGQITNNATVTYEARDASGTMIGTFSAITLGTTSGSGLKSTATFDPVTAAVIGTATITVRCGSASGTFQIQIN